MSDPWRGMGYGRAGPSGWPERMYGQATVRPQSADRFIPGLQGNSC